MGYLEKFEKQKKEAKQNVDYSKKRVEKKILNEEEIYGKIGDSLKKSFDKNVEEFKGFNSLRTLFPEAPRSPKENPDTMQIVETIPVDDGRNIEIRVDPRKKGRFTYVATKSEVLPNEFVGKWDVDWPPPIPQMTKKDIASLNVMEDGYVNFVKSSLSGAKEKAVERLMMEAALRDMTPHSDELLQPGYNLVNKLKKEYEITSKEEYLNKIKKFLETGKTGKIWSTVAPVVKPLATGLGVAGAALAPSADVAAAEILIPGGISEAAVSDERAISDPIYREYIKRMQERKK